MDVAPEFPSIRRGSGRYLERAELRLPRKLDKAAAALPEDSDALCRGGEGGSESRPSDKTSRHSRGTCLIRHPMCMNPSNLFSRLQIPRALD